jgi:alginate O-acetyltransferase complex protein AlgI
MLALAFAIALFGYREYRRSPEQHALLRWHPNAAWALVTALALSSSLLGMWQRLEFLYFRF